MNKFLDFIDLHKGEEEKGKVLDNVFNNTSFRGSNLWILACAIVIASVGLNVNSNAVIIGAMLISPLMGPILGAGFALGTYNFSLLKKSAKNLLIATVVGLAVSATYFFVSPFKDIQSELLARTAPNIYDVMIAFFGGLVGVIAVTRVEKGNPIPGVAIATALMPPLCTAGFGLATGNIKFFLGAIYLYTINCFFICLATFIIVKYLKYPITKQIDRKYEKQIRYGISFLILLMLLPSIWFAYMLFEEKKYSQITETFISNEFINKGYTLVYKKTNFASHPKKIELAFLTKQFNEGEIQDLNKKLADYKLIDAELIIRQDTSNLKNNILNEIGMTNRVIDEKDVVINNLKKEISANRFDNFQILEEAKVLFPELLNISVNNHRFFVNVDSARTVTAVLYESRAPMSQIQEQRMALWLKTKLKRDNVEVFRKK